jgi:hypothetical protein
MAWTTPMTFVDGVPLTASQLNIYLRDNMNQTEVAKATTRGGLFISSGVNSIVERFGGTHSVDTQETTSSTSFTNLDTVGPVVTCNTGSRAFWFMSAEMSSSGNDIALQIGIDISGKTTQAASISMQSDGIPADKAVKFGNCGFYEDLVPGENTFTMKYKVPSGISSTFGNRSLTIIPF